MHYTVVQGQHECYRHRPVHSSGVCCTRCAIRSDMAHPTWATTYSKTWLTPYTTDNYVLVIHELQLSSDICKLECACMQYIILSSRISQLFYSIERILCTVTPLPLSEWGDEKEEIIIDVFTSSTGEESYTMEMTPVEDTVMKWVLSISYVHCMHTQRIMLNCSYVIMQTGYRNWGKDFRKFARGTSTKWFFVRSQPLCVCIICYLNSFAINCMHACLLACCAGEVLWGPSLSLISGC